MEHARLQTRGIAARQGLQGGWRYASVAVGYLVLSVLICTVGRPPFLSTGEVGFRPDIALAALFLVIFGWRYMPVAVLAIAVEAVRTPVLGSNPGFVLSNVLVSGLIASGTAYCIGGVTPRRPWGSQRDLVVFATCVVFMPLALALVDMPFVKTQATIHPFFLAWLGAVVPLACILPAGIKLSEWAKDEDRKPLLEYLGQGISPNLQLIQLTVLLLATAFIGFERMTGGNGRIFPLYITVFWIALTSGLGAASVGFLLAEALFLFVNYLTKTPEQIFDMHLAGTVMGLGAVVAGALFTARNSAEDRLREQGKALQRQLAEMQVIRRLADSIIALREEGALYQLGAEAIGEQLQADQVWLLWVPSDGDGAEERGFWSSSRQTERDKFAPKFKEKGLAPVWEHLEQARTQLFSRADMPNARLVADKLDIEFHHACGIKTLLLHPFSFDASGFYVAAVLTFRRFRHWTDSDLQFLTAVADQITIALQKTQLLGERDERSRAFARMSQALVAETGESFFRNLVLRLAEAAGSRGAYVCRVHTPGTKATMLAFSDSGKVRREFAFDISEMPMEVTLELGSLAIDDRASERFPRFSNLTGVEARGFAATRLLNSQGEPLGTLAIYDDKPLADPDHVTTVLRLFAARASAEIERSERERLLRESEASYRRLLDTAHEGIWIVDEEGRTTFVNATMAAMLGYAAEDMLGDKLQEYAGEEDRQHVSSELQRELSGTASTQDVRFARRDGTLVWTLLSMSPIRGEDGEFRGALAMVTDITERKQTEQELDRLVHERTAELVTSNRELEAFCYSVSHDLRQPLRAIDGFSRAVVEDLGEDVSDEVRGHLSRVRKAANRMSELIDALLTLSRLSRIEMKRETVDLSLIADTILQELAKNDPARAKGYSVRKGMTATGDARLLHIVLENLLSNAWKFSSRAENPFVEIGQKKIDGRTCFYVKDNGIGFDMAYQSKLFKPFERLHSEQDFYGTGIGLATVGRIIARHGGQIWAEAEEGKGATFSFTL